MVGADVRVYCMSELWYMYVPKLKTFSALGVTGSVFMLKFRLLLAQCTYWRQSRLLSGQCPCWARQAGRLPGRPADSLQIWSAKYPNRINALYSLCQAVLPSYTGVQDRTTEYHRTELMSSEVNNFRLQTWSLTKTKGCYISWFSTNKPLSTVKNITNLLVHQKLGVSAGKLQVSEI